MKALKHFLLLLLIAATAAYVGYRFRLSRQALTALATQPQSTRAETQKSARSKKSKDLPPASPLVKKLENDIAMSKGVTRWLTWLETIEKAGAADFPRLFALAEHNSELVKLVATRWAEKFPKQFYDAVVARSNTGAQTPWEALEILFSTWAKSDPAAMIAALDASAESGGRAEWRDDAVNALIKNDVEAGLRLMSHWHIENYTPDLKNVPKWAAADPQHAAQFALQNPAGYASVHVLEIIAREWAKTDPQSALAFAQTAGSFKGTIGATALAQWAGTDLQKAGAWLAAAEPSTRNELSPEFIRAWAKTDLPAALEWSQANLSGSVLTRSVSAAIGSVADKDTSLASGFVLDMQPSPARALAASAVANKWFPDGFSNNTPPAEAIDWLYKLDPESAKSAIQQICWKWEESDPKGMAAYLENTPNNSLPDFIYDSLARNMARQNPAQALDWTARLPEKVRFAAAQTAFREFRQAQPEAAANWLAQLPADDPRQPARLLDQTLRDLAPEEQKTEQLTRFTAINEKAAETIFKEISLPEPRRAALLASLPSKTPAQK